MPGEQRHAERGPVGTDVVAWHAAGRSQRRECEDRTMAFFSSRLGVAGSIVVSVIGTIVLFVLFSLIF